MGVSFGDGKHCMQIFKHFIEERPQWRMETGAGFESWEIAGERESHPEVSEERRGHSEDRRLLENMNSGRQRTLLIQLRPLKAAQRISEYKRWPFKRERAKYYENGYL